MLHISDHDYMKEVSNFAEKRGIKHLLQKRLDYLDTYAEHGERGKTKCFLYRDFAPYSFQFKMKIKDKDRDNNYKDWFFGGLVYFGKGDSGFGSPQYTVRIGELDEGWSIHT